MTYSAQPLADLLERFAAGSPVPGGGPAAGISAALGTSLVIMGAALAEAKAAGDAAGALAASIVRLRRTQARLLGLADEDSVAYGAVIAASRLPKDTAAQEGVRATAFQAALHAATEAPLEILRRCEEVLAEAVVIAGSVPVKAKVDVAIGIELVAAAFRGCGLCVAENVRLLTSDEARRRLTEEHASVRAASTAHLERLHRDHAVGGIR